MYRTPTACKHRVSGSFSLPSRGPFHLSFTVLCAIGHWVVFSLGGWSPRLPARFHVSRSTPDPARSMTLSPTGLSPSLAGLSRTFPVKSSSLNAVHTPGCTHPGLGSSAFARRYLRNHCCFLFLSLLRCFTGYLLLPAAYRSLSRLSSAPSAKASTLRSFCLTSSSRAPLLFGPGGPDLTCALPLLLSVKIQNRDFDGKTRHERSRYP